MEIDNATYERLKADIRAEVVTELTQKDLHTNSQAGIWSDTREAWKKPLFDAFGVYHWAQVWTLVMRLSCYAVGVRYVRNLTPSTELKAAAFVDELCKRVIESRKESATHEQKE